MSIKKKGSRKLEVNNQLYLWKIRDNRDYKTLAIQKSDQKGVYTCHFADWICFDAEDCSMTPAKVKEIILELEKDGYVWNLEEVKLPSKLKKLSEKELIESLIKELSLSPFLMTLEYFLYPGKLFYKINYPKTKKKVEKSFSFKSKKELYIKLLNILTELKKLQK